MQLGFKWKIMESHDGCRGRNTRCPSSRCSREVKQLRVGYMEDRVSFGLDKWMVCCVRWLF